MFLVVNMINDHGANAMLGCSCRPPVHSRTHVFWAELVEGKGRPKEGHHAVPAHFVSGASAAKITALIERCVVSAQHAGSGRIYCLDSGFGYLPSAATLLRLGCFCVAVLKKKAHWPKGVPGRAILAHLHGKAIGTIM